MFKEMKLSNLTIQIEKDVFFNHLSGLGANMGQIDESKAVHRTNETASSIHNNQFINVEKFV